MMGDSNAPATILFCMRRCTIDSAVSVADNSYIPANGARRNFGLTFETMGK